MAQELKEVNGVVYIVKQCPGCKKELLFRQRKEAMRVYGACASCGKEFEFWLEK